jgi:hypothetical protein
MHIIVPWAAQSLRPVARQPSAKKLNLAPTRAANGIATHEIATGRRVRTIDTKPWDNRPRGIKMAPDGKSCVATLEPRTHIADTQVPWGVVTWPKAPGSLDRAE